MKIKTPALALALTLSACDTTPEIQPLTDRNTERIQDLTNAFYGECEKGNLEDLQDIIKERTAIIRGNITTIDNELALPEDESEWICTPVEEGAFVDKFDTIIAYNNVYTYELSFEPQIENPSQ